MALRHMLEYAPKWLLPDWVLERKENPDPTPVEADLDLVKPISSLDDLRRMMMQISKEKEEAGDESFEEFFDFGDDADFEDIPAPAQVKADAVQLARDRDFEGEIATQKAEYEKRVKEQARKEMLAAMREEEEQMREKPSRRAAKPAKEKVDLPPPDED